MESYRPGVPKGAGDCRGDGSLVQSIKGGTLFNRKRTF